MKERDRYKLHQFYQGEQTQIKFLDRQEIADDVYSCENLHIRILPIDFIGPISKNKIKEIETKWIAILPNLHNVKRLSIRHKINQDFFDTICKMTNLEELHCLTSNIEDVSNIAKLKKLQCLCIESFTSLTDISPILKLEELKRLSIENCFKVENFHLIGHMTQLIGLALLGNAFASKNLKIKSLKPFQNLRNLKHLDLSATTITDNSYDSILFMECLERFDISVKIPNFVRDKIKNNHKNLIAGFFMDWDFDNNRFYDDKEW